MLLQSISTSNIERWEGQAYFFNNIVVPVGTSISSMKSKFYRGDSKRQLQESVGYIHVVEQKKLVWVLDEPHLLEKETLEEFRFLLNCGFDSESPMALVLVGQVRDRGRRLLRNRTER